MIFERLFSLLVMFVVFGTLYIGLNAIQSLNDGRIDTVVKQMVKGR